MPDDEIQSAFELTGALTTTSHDEATALAVMSELDKWWATSGIGTLRRAPGQPGVKARVYADIRRSGTQATQRTDDGPDVVQVGLGHGARWNLDLNMVRSIEALPDPGSLPAFLQVKGGFHPPTTTRLRGQHSVVLFTTQYPRTRGGGARRAAVRPSTPNVIRRARRRGPTSRPHAVQAGRPA
ncbi:DUF6207 family protein [Streptomyces sp. NPDC005279]|uniref:DUF6207 family protein n=1 Tax=Streptomyces sp. NPDC005279 TaxID=3364712 RepID=UPI0036BF633C